MAKGKKAKKKREEPEGDKRAQSQGVQNPGARKWTVMVFMGTAAVDGRLPLHGAAFRDMAEMRAIGSNGRLNIFVERHDADSVTREHIGKAKTEFSKSGGFEPKPDDKSQGTRKKRKQGQADALTTFVGDALIAAGHQPADHSMLVLWGHTYDFAFGHERTRDGTIDALEFTELSAQLRAFQGAYQKQQKLLEAPKLDIIGFDSCEVSTVEMACQLQPYAHYLLASQIGIPLPGWPYDRILERLAEPKGRLMYPREFGAYVVRRFCESYEATQDAVSLTLLDLADTEHLAAHIGVLAQRLTIAAGIDPSTADLVAELFVRSQTDPGRPYVDVADLCVNLIRESADAPTIAAATALGNFLCSPAGNTVKTGVESRRCPFVAEHGRNAGSLARLNGLSLYAPHLAPGKDPSLMESLYAQFSFTKLNFWGRLVHALAQP